jgi:hypothetical protein
VSKPDKKSGKKSATVDASTVHIVRVYISFERVCAHMHASMCVNS